MSDTRTLGQMIADCHREFVVKKLAAFTPEHPAEPALEAREETPVNATIPRSLRWATLDAPELPLRVGRDLAIAEAKAAMDAPGMLLFGTAGCGKTSLACALMRAWEARQPRRRALFVSAWKLAVARAQHGLGRGEARQSGT